VRLAVEVAATDGHPHYLACSQGIRHEVKDGCGGISVALA